MHQILRIIALVCVIVIIFYATVAYIISLVIHAKLTGRGYGPNYGYVYGRSEMDEPDVWLRGEACAARSAPPEFSSTGVREWNRIYGTGHRHPDKTTNVDIILSGSKFFGPFHHFGQ